MPRRTSARRSRTLEARSASQSSKHVREAPESTGVYLPNARRRKDSWNNPSVDVVVGASVRRQTERGRASVGRVSLLPNWAAYNGHPCAPDEPSQVHSPANRTPRDLVSRSRSTRREQTRTMHTGPLGSTIHVLRADAGTIAALAAVDWNRHFRQVCLDPVRGLITLMAPSNRHEDLTSVFDDLVEAAGLILAGAARKLRSPRLRGPDEPPGTGWNLIARSTSAGVRGATTRLARKGTLRWRPTSNTPRPTGRRGRGHERRRGQGRALRRDGEPGSCGGWTVG